MQNMQNNQDIVCLAPGHKLGMEDAQARGRARTRGTGSLAGPRNPVFSAPCARAETYLRALVLALGTDGAWLALVHGREGVKLHVAVGALCNAGDVHAWQNSLSLWTCSPATHRVLIINDTTLDARRVFVTSRPCGRARQG